MKNNLANQVIPSRGEIDSIPDAKVISCRVRRKDDASDRAGEEIGKKLRERIHAKTTREGQGRELSGEGMVFM